MAQVITLVAAGLVGLAGALVLLDRAAAGLAALRQAAKATLGEMEIVESQNMVPEAAEALAPLEEMEQIQMVVMVVSA